MSTTLPTPPTLSGHIWRPLRREDAPALYRLERECAPIDGDTNPGTDDHYHKLVDHAGGRLATDTICAAASSGRLAAGAWIRFDDTLAHEYRAFLEGRVHPEHRRRGLGRFLLHRMETRARQVFATIPGDRPRVMRIDFYDRGDDAVALYEQAGFEFAFAEDEMRRDLSRPIPANPLPPGMTFSTWTPERAGDFFGVYEDAFRGRPGFPDWAEDVWRDAFTGHSSFRADLSLLISEGEEHGWIDQLGVRPPWRGRGLAGALLSEIMRRCQTDGLRHAMLDVNIDNPQAIGVYERLRFELFRRRTVYKKTIR